MNDTIFIHGITVHARHGMLNHEAEVGQRFVIDVELFVALLEASHTDELTDTVCYADVARATISTFACQNYQLLERAAGAVGDTILATFPRISAVKVTVHKPHASIAAIFQDIGVTINRHRRLVVR
jgi:7,8-dihydroneopterin aldolase/epimerase/oxygenase